MPKTDFTSTSVDPSRRGILTAAAGLLALGGATAGVSAVAASPGTSLDARLIAMCAEHAVNRDAFNRDGSLDDRDDPLWLAYERTRDAISAAEPQTMEGVLAKAQAAKAEARRPDGIEDPEGSPAARWAWQVLNDLVRLSGAAAATGAVQAAPLALPAVHPDADLIAMCDRIVATDEERERLESPYYDTYGSPPHISAQTDAVVAEGHRLSEAVAEMHAATREGLRAKARAMRSYACCTVDGDPGWENHSELLGWSIVRDLLRGA